MNREFSNEVSFLVVRYFLLILPLSLVLINYESVKCLLNV
jgi:hypothetical protein